MTDAMPVPPAPAAPTAPLLIRRAGQADLQAALRLLAASAAWMHAAGWNAWPPEGFPPERVAPGIAEGTVWLAFDGTGDGTGGGDRPVATLTLDQTPDPEFTAPQAYSLGVGDYLPGSFVLHRLAVSRTRAGQGIGPVLLDWAADRTHRHGGPWLLANMARNAEPLHRWYGANGFKHIATITTTRRPDGLPRKSGMLRARPAARVPDLHLRIAEID